MRLHFKKVFPILLLILCLFLTVYYLPKLILDLRKSAAGFPANILVDVQSSGTKISPSLWQNIAQGGEEATDMIGPVVPELKDLHPQLIRLDHLFDFYKVDQGNGQYDFSRLDKTVDSILATGAIPMLSLSYTPDSKAPADWTQWFNLVSATAHHYSVDKKTDGIYYEVWNEPDLFGGWHYNKDPNYSTLYIKTAQAVATGAGNAQYKIGGPATTAYYGNWIKSLFKTATDNHLRLDFVSWHQYSTSISDYTNDFDNLNQILSDYPQYFNIERLITEVGPNSEPDSSYDSAQSGVHLISLVTQLYGKIHRIFTFEAVDGPSPRSDKSTGWGILTHDQKPKPRYFAIQFLNQLQGQQLSSSGDGSWVTSLSSKNGPVIQTLVVNYDPNNSHVETVPITFQGLTPGKYQLKTTQYLGKTTSKTFTIPTTTYTENLYLDSNTAYLLELQMLQ
jgi:beta-xylosidase